MAKPKSEDKRNAILAAATHIFAERGLNMPTSAISSGAGVAEGTLFTYFKTKDELVNVLYREVKQELGQELLSGYPGNGSVRHRLRHVWDRYVNWGVENPMKQSVMRQIEVWSGLTEASKTAGAAPFVEIEAMAEDAVTEGIFQEFPERFIAATIRSLAETTMEFMRHNPNTADAYCDAGFTILWAGLTHR